MSGFALNEVPWLNTPRSFGFTASTIRLPSGAPAGDLIRRLEIAARGSAAVLRLVRRARSLQTAAMTIPYRPDTLEGQLSVGYIGDRDGRPEAAFRTACMELAQGLEAEAASKGMSGHFEIVVSGD